MLQQLSSLAQCTLLRQSQVALRKPEDLAAACGISKRIAAAFSLFFFFLYGIGVFGLLLGEVQLEDQ